MFLEMSQSLGMERTNNAFQYPLWIDVFGNDLLVQLMPDDFDVSVSSLDRCFWKSIDANREFSLIGRFSILFGSMFLEISCSISHSVAYSLFQYPLWIDVFGNLAVSGPTRQLSQEFQYPLWIDVFGNFRDTMDWKCSTSRFSILFGSMFLEIVPETWRNGVWGRFQYPLWIDVFGNFYPPPC